MDYTKLLQRLAELDQPTNEACGEMSPAPMAPSTPPPTPPSMSVNLNAQGMDSIESLLKLMTKVNPDMINPSAPAIEPKSAAMIMPPVDIDGEEDGPLDGDKNEIAPLAAVGAGLGRAAAGAMGAGSLGKAAGSMAGSSIGSAAADMMNSQDDEVESREDFANEPEEEVKDVDYILNKVSGGMNKPQGTYPKVAGGDNPMQKTTRMEGDELRAAIRTELQQRLAEAKGAK
jgi:hypothetical protein